MGVRGLTTYINFNQNAFLHDFLLHDTCLIIDGHSLCAQLYKRLNCFSAFGGDYDKFASYVRNFFKNLRKCNITSYVLFDGSYEQRKLKTAFSRVRSKINGASRLDPVTQGCLQIFPLLLRDVFIEALTDMNIAYTVCEFEADDEIAALARHLNCPVLSYDSDFFIYNVLYIPFNTLESKPTPIEENGNKTYALECKIYKVEHLTSHFGGLKEDLLPLLATLLGNDFVEKKVFRKFFSQLKLPKGKNSKNEQQRCIHGLFKWLQNETLDSAIAKILGRLKKAHKSKVFYIIKKSINGYNSTHCESLKYFNISEEISQPITLEDNFDALLYDNVTEDETDNKTESESADGNRTDSESEDDSSNSDESSYEADVKDELVMGLPLWLAERIRHNHIPKPYINLYTLHLYFCSPQAEDYNADDSFLCTLPILRYAFDIMTDFSEENCIYISREKDCNYRRLYINNEYAISRPLNIPFQDLTDEQFKTCFHHFLQTKIELLDVTVIEELPSNFRLFMISILWWVHTCDVPLGHVHSLLICYTMLEVIDERTGTFRGHNHFNNKYSKKLEELKKTMETSADKNELYLNKNKVLYEDCLIAASSLLKHFELDDKIKKKPKSYDTKVMHSLAQFQCCLLQFNSLNTLCCCPYESTKYSKSFNGTFVYNIAVKLENQIDPRAFLGQYLKGSKTVLMFYTSLCSIYQKCAEIMDLKTAVKNSGKKRRRRKNVELDELSFIVKGFESEVVI